MIEHKNILLTLFLVHTISNGCSSWFIDDPHNCEPCNHSRILGSLSLGVIEVCWYSHDSVGDLLPKESLGSLLDRFEGIEFDIILNSLVRPVTTDHPLGVEHGVLGIGGQLVLGSISY